MWCCSAASECAVVDRRRNALVAVIGVVGSLAVGCTDDEPVAIETTIARSLPPGEDRPLPEGDEPEVLGPLGDTEIELETDEGVVQIGSGDVPDVVPAGFPLPDDLVVQLASQAGDEAGFSGVSEVEFDELVDFYAVELAAAGYETEQTQFVDGVVAVFEFVGSAGGGSVAISSAPGGGRSVLVTFSG